VRLRRAIKSARNIRYQLSGAFVVVIADSAVGTSPLAHVSNATCSISGPSTERVACLFALRRKRRSVFEDARESATYLVQKRRFFGERFACASAFAPLHTVS
jgi:hypothetical protein